MNRRSAADPDAGVVMARSTIAKRARTISRLRKLARRTDITETLAIMVRTLVQQGVDLPCRITIDDGTVYWVVDAGRASATYGKNTPDEAFLINVEVKAGKA
jgi:hypothetical protein